MRALALATLLVASLVTACTIHIGTGDDDDGDGDGPRSGPFCPGCPDDATPDAGYDWWTDAGPAHDGDGGCGNADGGSYGDSDAGYDYTPDGGPADW